MATPDQYGVGLDVIYGWPRSFTYASGYRNLGNGLARRLQTVRGSLPWAQDCGWDLRQLLRGSFTSAELASFESAIAAECEKDERVESATAAITYIAQARTLVVTVTVTGADGPFVLVLSVTDLSVTVLRLARQ